MAAVRDLPEPTPFQVRVLDADAWTLLRGQSAVTSARDDHALALAGLGLLEEPGGLASHTAQRRQPSAWDPDLGVLLATAGGLDHPSTLLAAAQSVLPSCGPADLTWDALRVSEALEQGMAMALVWKHDLLEAGLPNRGLVIDPSLPLARWRGLPEPSPTPLQTEDEAIAALGVDVVLRLLDAGEWRSADLACRRPPSSTAALLHPERWQDAEGPSSVGPPQVREWRDGGWSPVHNDRIGELGLATWLAQTAQVASPEEARELAAGWRGDAVSVWQRGTEPRLRAAWTLSLTPKVRRELARLLHGRVLPDGRVVLVRPGPGDSLVLLIGGSGDAVVTVLETQAGGVVGVRVSSTVDVASWERTLRLHANRAAAEDGVARVGKMAFPLDEQWQVGRRGMDGEVLSLRYAGTRLRLDLYEAPSLLVGPAVVAAERIARLMGSQNGLENSVRVRQVGGCAVASLTGHDRNHKLLEIRVQVMPQGQGTLIARASYQPRSVPLAYHRLVDSLEKSSCRGPVARGSYSSSSLGQ
jgi:hypothetical protein